MTQFCDLHVHSTYSDGTLSPAELIQQAKAIGLGAIALCDHNTVDGLPDFLRAARGSGVEAVCGIEFSTDYGSTELHLLGLFVSPEHFPAIRAQLNTALQRKEESNIALVAALNAAGLSLDYAAIKAGTPNGQVNRAVIAAEMVRLGYCGSIPEAFRSWLSPKAGYYVPPRRLDVFETIRFVRSLGAVPVLAHPFLNLQEEELREFLRQAVPAGLSAMETEYSTFTQEQTVLARKIAAEFGILPSGGSDFHGGNKPEISLGTGRGNLGIPMAYLEAMKHRRK